MKNYQLIFSVLYSSTLLNFIYPVSAQDSNFILTQNQEIPNPITPKKPITPIPELPDSQPPPDLKQPKNAPNPLPDNIPGGVFVKEFKFIGNTAFSDTELAEKLVNYTNRSLSFVEVLEAEQIITDTYINAGYINSGAVIKAEQTFDLKAAVIEISIIEGSIKEIIITGNETLKGKYIRSRLHSAKKIPFNQNKLLEDLQLLQLNPLITRVSAELSSGVRREESVLEIEISESDSFDLTLFSNNGRSPSVGSWRRGFSLQENNLNNIGDTLALNYTNTDGSNGFDASYTIPFNGMDGTITVNGGFSDTEVIEKPFSRLDILGDSRYFDLTVRQPLVRSPRQDFALGLTTSFQRSQTKLGGEQRALSRGANDDGETKISAIRFFQDWTKRNPNDVIALRSQFSLGVDVLDATINEESLPDSRFFSWRGQAQYVRRLAPETLFVLRSDLQLAADELVPLERYGLGGFNSIRGYRQDTLLTDNAFFLSGEVRLPILRAKKIDGILHIVPFVDFGIGWNTDVPDPDSNSLVGVGLGLNWQMGDRFNARLDWGIPLTDTNDTDNTWQENGIYFSLDYKLF